MKSIVIIAAIAALSLSSCGENVDINNKAACCKKSECCKNCDDHECKTTCEEVRNLSTEELNSMEGEALVAKCKTLCEKNECCSEEQCQKHEDHACCTK